MPAYRAAVVVTSQPDAPPLIPWEVSKDLNLFDKVLKNYNGLPTPTLDFSPIDTAVFDILSARAFSDSLTLSYSPSTTTSPTPPLSPSHLFSDDSPLDEFLAEPLFADSNIIHPQLWHQVEESKETGAYFEIASAGNPFAVSPPPIPTSSLPALAVKPEGVMPKRVVSKVPSIIEEESEEDKSEPVDDDGDDFKLSESGSEAEEEAVVVVSTRSTRGRPNLTSPTPPSKTIRSQAKSTPFHDPAPRSHLGKRTFSGIRSYEFDPVPVDAPIQPRIYTADSKTSRKAIPKAVEKQLNKRRRRSVSREVETASPLSAVKAEEGEEPLPESEVEAMVTTARERNTRAARVSRQRKAEAYAKLVSEVVDLREENERLRERLAAFEGEMEQD